uniref:NADH dehydrogenase subunit 2 n=1 Tax=Athousius wudanganus TaxID=1028072 RepID=UPI002E7698D0|nr:NADH dehydrogenase subunit 2 [Athousius wudanganus]UBS90997.1 NADH dehydrogenase subunit 2 [Athousius wudanganus]
MTKAYKILFFSTLTLSTLISISSYSWLGMWLGLEINLLSIIPLMHNQKNILSTESTVKYFIVQAMASTIILASIISMMASKDVQASMDLKNMNYLSMNSALLTKMGMAPFHFWFPEVMEGLSWMNCLLILTWQKIAPMILLMYNMKFIMFLTTIIVMSMIISGLMGVNQISLRKILAYSSINHMGWMISTMMIFQTIWMTYFLVYLITSINIILVLKNLNIFFLNQLYQSMNNYPMTKLFLILNFLSLSGIPPFLGFLPKWLTIQALLTENMIFLPTIMIIFTIFMIFVYTRISISSLLMNTNEFNWNLFIKSSKFESMSMSILNFFTISSLIIITMVLNML